MTRKDALLEIEDIMIKASNLHTLYKYHSPKHDDYINVCREYRKNLDRMTDKEFQDMLPEVEEMSKEINKTYMYYAIHG